MCRRLHESLKKDHIPLNKLSCHAQVSLPNHRNLAVRGTHFCGHVEIRARCSNTLQPLTPSDGHGPDTCPQETKLKNYVSSEKTPWTPVVSMGYLSSIISLSLARALSHSLTHSDGVSFLKYIFLSLSLFSLSLPPARSRSRVIESD